MTAAKAATCVSAIVNAGFDVRTSNNPLTGDWTVVARANGGQKIVLAQAQALATAQQVTGTIIEVEYV